MVHFDIICIHFTFIAEFDDDEKFIMTICMWLYGVETIFVHIILGFFGNVLNKHKMLLVYLWIQPIFDIGFLLFSIIILEDRNYFTMLISICKLNFLPLF